MDIPDLIMSDRNDHLKVGLRLIFDDSKERITN